MNDHDEVVLKLDIEKGTPCELKHKEFHYAVDYITQHIGYDNKPTYTLNVPVCDDCINYLLSPEWVLLFCLKCTSNQWVNRLSGRLFYPDKHICWMSCCPGCKESNETVNIFFSE